MATISYTVQGSTMCLDAATTELLDESVDARVRSDVERQVRADAILLAASLGRSVVVETSHGTTRKDLGADAL